MASMSDVNGRKVPEGGRTCPYQGIPVSMPGWVEVKEWKRRLRCCRYRNLRGGGLRVVSLVSSREKVRGVSTSD